MRGPLFITHKPHFAIVIPHAHPRTYLYRPSLDSAITRDSIEAAKPVMALHRRIGKLEMTGHRLVSENGAVQETVFADGTRVTANFSNVSLPGPSGAVLGPESWEAVPALGTPADQ